MSLKTLLTPPIAQWLLSRKRLMHKRQQAEKQRLRQGKAHCVLYFHQVDDPYSYLVVQCLERLQQRYNITLQIHLVNAPDAAVAPERDKLVAYSRRDAAMIASHYGLHFTDHGTQPSTQSIAACQQTLFKAIQTNTFVSQAAHITKQLWDSTSKVPANNTTLPASNAEANVDADLGSHMQYATQLRHKLGHYLGGMLYYAGEWYWGVDRLHHLEHRLISLQTCNGSAAHVMFPMPQEDFASSKAFKNTIQAPVLDFYVSLRSPYSAIATPRVFALAAHMGISVNIKGVLPMVMRGLPVPAQKRRYISQDTAREAFVRGIDFGKLNDPVGRPTERGLAILPYARSQGLAPQYLSRFMHGVWAQGLDAGSDRDLRRIVAECGLSWQGAQIALNDPSWRLEAEANRASMFDLGLWGVPAFHIQGTDSASSVWGQDRLWLIHEQLKKLASETQHV